jgi:hypothetical protein
MVGSRVARGLSVVAGLVASSVVVPSWIGSPGVPRAAAVAQVSVLDPAFGADGYVELPIEPFSDVEVATAPDSRTYVASAHDGRVTIAAIVRDR